MTLCEEVEIFSFQDIKDVDGKLDNHFFNPEYIENWQDHHVVLTDGSKTEDSLVVLFMTLKMNMNANKITIGG